MSAIVGSPAELRIIVEFEQSKYHDIKTHEKWSFNEMLVFFSDLCVLYTYLALDLVRREIIFETTNESHIELLMLIFVL